MISQGSGAILFFGGSGDPIRDYFIGGTQVAFDTLETMRRQLAVELGPHPPTQVFVLTHEAPDAVPEGSVYTFVTDGIESALKQAKAAAGEKNVAVMGGPDIGRQFIEAGLVDEIGVHLVPVLFGSGTRMFEHLGGEHIQLETTSVIETPAAIHLGFRVVR